MTLSVTSPIFQQVNSPALDIRRFISSLAGAEGVVAAADMAPAQRAAGANMSVDIAAGQALVQGDGITNQGMYYAYNDGVVNLAVAAAHATLPRIDRVCLRLRDAFHGAAANDLTFVIVAGTATSGATLANLTGAAAVPASHLLLANILIPAAATTVTTANIDATVRAPWIAPTLLNSWVNFGGAFARAGYMKDALGFVHLRGAVKDGTGATAQILTLPAGHRPGAQMVFVVAGPDPTTVLMNVHASGAVAAGTGGSTTAVCLDGISFLAEN